MEIQKINLPKNDIELIVQLKIERAKQAMELLGLKNKYMCYKDEDDIKLLIRIEDEPKIIENNLIYLLDNDFDRAFEPVVVIKPKHYEEYQKYFENKEYKVFPVYSSVERLRQHKPRQCFATDLATARRLESEYIEEFYDVI